MFLINIIVSRYEHYNSVWFKNHKEKYVYGKLNWISCFVFIITDILSVYFLCIRFNAYAQFQCESTLSWIKYYPIHFSFFFQFF